MSDDQSLENRLSEMLDATRDRAREPMPPLVEQRVLARVRETMERDSRPRWWLFLAGGLVAAAIIAVVAHTLINRSASALGVVAQVGNVAVVPKGGSVNTGAQARALLEVPLARVTVLPETNAAFSYVSPRRVHVKLSQGSFVANVEPNHPERAFTVTLPHAEVTITGTVFYVAARSSGSQVAVERGHVMVRRASKQGGVEGEAVSVSAGELIEVGPVGLARRALHPDEKAAMLASLQVATWQAPSTQPLTMGLTVAEPPPEDLPSFEPSPAPPPAPLGRAVVQRARSGKREVVAKDPSSGVAALLAQRDCAGARAALDARHDRSDEASRSWFEVAQCFNATGDVPAAIVGYREVVRRFPSAVVSENAAYEIARLSRELHRNDEAEAAFADYVARYPKGALTQEAYFWRCHMAATNGHIDQALSCLRAFRERFPTSARVNETNFSEATLLRTSKHDCQGALTAYERYLQSPGEHREQAEQWRAWCAARLH